MKTRKDEVMEILKDLWVELGWRVKADTPTLELVERIVRFEVENSKL